MIYIHTVDALYFLTLVGAWRAIAHQSIFIKIIIKYVK